MKTLCYAKKQSASALLIAQIFLMLGKFKKIMVEKVQEELAK